jgi:hypothetical protein
MASLFGLGALSAVLEKPGVSQEALEAIS